MSYLKMVFGVLTLCFFVMSESILAKGKSSETLLRETVKARWDAMSSHDFAKVYSFQTPVYRSVFPDSLFVHKFGADIRWSLTKIQDIKYDSATNLATVVTEVKTERNSNENVSKRDAFDVILMEKWFYIDGKWWHSFGE